MRGAVVLALLTGLIMGFLAGGGVAAVLFLPVQANLVEERIKAQEARNEAEQNAIMIQHSREDAENANRQLLVQNARLQRALTDAEKRMKKGPQ